MSRSKGRKRYAITCWVPFPIEKERLQLGIKKVFQTNLKLQIAGRTKDSLGGHTMADYGAIRTFILVSSHFLWLLLLASQNYKK